MFSEYMIVAVFYILGIIISKTFDMSGAIALTLLIFTAAVVRVIHKRPQSFGIILLSAVFLFGSVRYFDESQNRLFYEFPDKYVTVSGTIYSLPSTSEGEYKNRYILKLDTVSYLDKTAYTGDKILLYTKETFPFGTKVTASGFLNEISGINNEYEFDTSLYYKGKGIFACLTAREIHKTGTGFSLSPDFLAGIVRYHAATLIDSHFQDDSAAFLKAIVTGDKSGFSGDYLTLLIKTSIYRILYTPFIHISLIFFIAGFLPLGKKPRDAFIILMISLYALANSSSPTIIKAAMLCGLLILSKQLFGFANKIDLISKIVLMMTVFDPLLCFNSGFLMSVSASIILYFSYKPIYRRFSRLFRRFKIKTRIFLSKTSTLWVTFLFGTLPISAYLFNGVSVYAVIFMTVSTPIILAVLLLSPFMLLSLSIFGVSPVLAPIIGMIMDFIAFLPELISWLPAYYISLRTPKIWEIIIFYLMWWIFLRILSAKLKNPKTVILSLIVSGLLLSGLPFYQPDILSIYFVNVGQGDGAVLHTAKGETVLIDGGGSAEYETNYNIGERVFLPYLISHGFSDIDVAIATHCHKDHIEGIIAAAENLRINTIVMPNSDPDNQYRLRLEELAEEQGIDLEYLARGDEINFKSGLKIKFISPDPAQLKSSELNDTSLVAHVTYGEFSALFTGDSTDDINATYPEDVDLLKVAHHGSDTSTSREYLDRTSPEYAVISVGENNSYNLPSDNVVERLRQSGAKILRTDKHGDIQFKIKKDGSFTYKTLRGE